MAISKIVNGANTTVTFSYTAVTQKVTDTLTDAAKNLFNQGFTAGVVLNQGETVDNLTQNEIGTIIDIYVKRILIDAAKEYYVNTAQFTSRSTAVNETNTRYL